MTFDEHAKKIMDELHTLNARPDSVSFSYWNSECSRAGGFKRDGNADEKTSSSL